MPAPAAAPPDYGDWLLEYRAVRTAAGLLDLSACGKLVVTGRDRYSWLQGMVSQDVRRLEAGERGLGACILDATGHLITDLRMTPVPGDAILLDLPSGNVARVLDLLDGFVISENVEIVDQTEFLACLSVQGPGADAVWEQVGVPEGSTFAPPALPGLGGMVAYMPADRAPQTWAHLVAEGAVPVGETAAEVVRIEAGVARWGAELDESILPPEAGLDATHVSYGKGCYVGQEVLARIRSRGHTNRALTGLRVDGDRVPAAGSSVYAADADGARDVGRVTSACHSPAVGRAIALAYVRHEQRAPGTALRIRHPEGDIDVVTTALPFVGASP